MATIIRHGAAGSYKSACAVWFDLLPALREGRTVVTNIQGMRKVEQIEKALSERFPPSARIISIYSTSEKGRYLWQNYYNWLPIGAMVVIDEAQDIFNKTVGFDMAKNVNQGLQPFLKDLPPWFEDFYNKKLESFKPEEIDVDDTGQKLVDENGLIILPPTFEESFMRHRHFNWDIILCTPNIKKIPTEIKAVSELALSHKSKDSFGFSKRKPRIFEHDPLSSSTTPKKGDNAPSVKVPLAVHMLYKSTVTGHTTKSGVAASPLKNLKLVGGLIILLCSLSLFVVSIYDIFSSSSDDSLPTTEIIQTIDTSSDQNNQTVFETSQTDNKNNQADSEIHTSEINGLSSSYVSSQVDNANGLSAFLETPPTVWPYPITNLYVSGVHLRITKQNVFKTIIFEQRFDTGEVGYVYNSLLEKIGYKFEVLDKCLVKVMYQQDFKLIACDSKPVKHIIIEEDEEPYQEEVFAASPVPDALESSILPI